MNFNLTFKSNIFVLRSCLRVTWLFILLTLQSSCYFLVVEEDEVLKAGKEGNEIPIPDDIPVHLDFTASDEVKKIIIYRYIKINSLFKREAPPRDQWGIISCSQLAIGTQYET